MDDRENQIKQEKQETQEIQKIQETQKTQEKQEPQETKAAVILAAGSGRRMNAPVAKQFLDLMGSPVFLHSVRMFDQVADKIVLVTSPDAVAYCRSLLAEEHLHAETIVVAGKSERFLSSMEGVKAASDCDLIMIHDAARACVSMDVIQHSIASAKTYGSGVAAVPLKDTVKVADENGMVFSTPDRSTLRVIQTPQTFKREVICTAYERLAHIIETKGLQAAGLITDDAMVVEQFTDNHVYLSEGSYENIKLTTPEDMTAAQGILANRGK